MLEVNLKKYLNIAETFLSCIMILDVIEVNVAVCIDNKNN